jgi:hypothetical protein
MLLDTYVLFWYTLEKLVEKVAKIDMELKEIVKTRTSKKQSKYRCPCCNKLWGSKVKFNCHWLYTPCDGAKAIEDHKPWPVITIVVKEIS